MVLSGQGRCRRQRANYFIGSRKMFRLAGLMVLAAVAGVFSPSHAQAAEARPKAKVVRVGNEVTVSQALAPSARKRSKNRGGGGEAAARHQRITVATVHADSGGALPLRC
jgi:hypothetical protein